MLPLASSKGLFAEEQLDEYLETAKLMVIRGEGDRIITLPGWYWATTPRSFLDLSKNLPRLLYEAARIKCPVLFIKGEHEPEDLYPAKKFKSESSSTVDIVTLKNTDHFYTGSEKLLIDIVCEWLRALST